MTTHPTIIPDPPATSADVPIDPHLAAALDRELDPGERLIWQGRPRPDLALRSALANAWLLLLFGVLFSGFMIAAAVSIWLRPATVPRPAFDAVFSILVIILGLALLAWIISEPARAAARARRTIYAITDRRAIILTRTRRGRIEERDFSPDETRHILRIERPDAAGDIIFESTRRTATGSSASISTLGRVGFLSVDDCAQVERTLRTTLQRRQNDL